MVKLRSKRFSRISSFKFGGSGNVKSTEKADHAAGCGGGGGGGSIEVKWEVRPGGMLVQKREETHGQSVSEEPLITIRVSTTFSKWHDISIEPTSTFGELKMILSLVTSLEPREQRLLFKGKEREDCEYLHMVGVREKDKMLLLQDPAIKDMKLHGTTYRTISV
ncbi:BAG family molecular chaperone regulator 2-like [Tripterygium wilfordii]|uniref:BAG family molecular chaperone regulator 2-like n=1 Tax=Tripterygium wilfordii TaxID=458696 RepID=A0A7J7CZR7_TRIWF|nr:BAG family molecular chaperone regulator 1-like [Tripterygium wilfordii]KAF5739581.1 BAG family molecular chaperone regulator 2-like [Tripterygium wilfordii]